MSDTIKPNEKPSTKPVPLHRYSPEEWRRRLEELGVRNATLDPGGPTAFELPGFPGPSLSRKSQPDKPAGR